jgi:hypothetical protein
MKNLITLLFIFISINLYSQVDDEPNNNFNESNLIIVSTNWQGYIDFSGDNDYYKFNIMEPGIIQLVAITVPGDVYLRGKIYAPDMIGIRTGTSALGGGYEIEVSTCDTGEHFIHLSNASIANNASDDPYMFRVEFTPFSELDTCECENESFNEACLINTGENVDALIAPLFDDNPTKVDDDYYKFNIPEPGILKLVVTFVPGNIFLRGEIYTPDMIGIRTGTSPLGQGYQIEVSTCDTGYHFIHLFNAGSVNVFSSEEQYSFRVEFTPFSELDMCECENESFNEACLINTGENVDALIAPLFDDNPVKVDDDYYKFNIPEPGILKLVVTSVPDNIFLRGEIYTPDMIEIRRETSALGQGYQIEVSTCDTGYHFIHLFNAGSVNAFSSEEQYSFRVEFTPFSQVDPCECNNSFNTACAIEICDTVQAVIAPWFDDDSFIVDSDLYQIELSSSEEININISSASSIIGICVYIYDSSQSQIETFSGNVGQDFNFNYTPPSDGIYYFEIADCNGNFDSQNQYELTIGCNLISSTVNLELTEIVNVSPNPFSENFNIDFKNRIEEEYEITLFNVLGKAVFTQNNIEVDNLSINATAFPEGVYVLQLRIDDIYYSTKLLKIE